MFVTILIITLAELVLIAFPAFCAGVVWERQKNGVCMRASAEEIIKSLIEELRGPDGRAANRETALAITKLEEALLWLVYGSKLK